MSHNTHIKYKTLDAKACTTFDEQTTKLVPKYPHRAWWRLGRKREHMQLPTTGSGASPIMPGLTILTCQIWDVPIVVMSSLALLEVATTNNYCIILIKQSRVAFLFKVYYVKDMDSYTTLNKRSSIRKRLVPLNRLSFRKIS